MARNRDSYFANAPEQYVDFMRRLAARNRRIACDSGLPWYVSTPDLLLDCPGSSWLPVTVDCARWRSDDNVFHQEIPTVLHIPSRRVPPIKGTEYIDPVLRGLAANGRIRYLAPDHVPHDRMVALVHKADIVIDQLMTNSYGAAAIEAMASGRIVVGNVGELTRRLMPIEPPIVDSAPTRLAQTMESILGDRETYMELAAKGPVFAAAWHDGFAAAETLATFLGLDVPDRERR